MAHNPNFFCVIYLQMQWYGGSHRDLPLGGVENTAAVLWPHPSTRLPGPSGHPERHRGYPTGDCYTGAATGPTVRCLFVCVVVTVLQDALWAFPHANKGTTFPSSQLVHFAAYQDKHVGTGIIVSH